MIYILIFIAKIIENCLSTLRLILVANGKKVIGAILQAIVTLIWLFSAATVIININSDIYKIVFFVLGSLVGSYLGSLLEEKLAFGNNLVIVNISKTKGLLLYNIIKGKYKTNIINDSDYLTVMIKTTRKKRPEVVSLIKIIDNDADIYTLKVLS